jgi:uncharacterized protein YqgQ
MNSKFLQTLEKGYIRLNWFDYVNRVHLSNDNLSTIITLIDNFKGNKNANELIMFRFEGIPAYVMFTKEEYVEVLEWIKNTLIDREQYEMCKDIIRIMKYIEKKKNDRYKRNIRRLENSEQSNA